MKVNSIKPGLVIVCGWLVILASAAIVLPSTDTRRFSVSTVSILVLAVAWLVLTIVALGIYFYRAWRRVSQVPNRTLYIAWLSFETACTLALAGTLIWLFAFGAQIDSVGRMRELTLRGDLVGMRAILKQYSVDKHKRPQSLDELVAAGYLKQVPTDPMTGRIDSWTVEWSDDPHSPGIVNVRSGSGTISSKGNAYREW